MWRRVEGLTTDSNGALYLAGDAEGAGSMVWAFGSDFVSTRWVINPPPLPDPSLAFSPAGEILLWSSSRNQAVRVGCADGQRIGVPLGSQGGALDFRNAESVSFDPQNNLFTLNDDRLRRFTLDGTEIAAWPAPDATQDTEKQFWELGDKPKRFDTHNAFASTGWDGQFYLAGWNGPMHVARYDASGKRLARAPLPFMRTYLRGRPWADRQGRVYVFAEIGVVSDEADHSHLAVLRLSPDFKTLERLVEAKVRRAELNDHLAVAPDGTMFIAGSRGSLYVFGPDGALLFMTKPNELPAFSTGATANRGEAVSSLSRRKGQADRADENEPTLVEMLLFIGSIFVMPFALYYLGIALGRKSPTVSLIGLFAGFLCAPAVSGWVGMKRAGWFRVPTAGRWLCGVFASLAIGAAVMVAAGVDPLGLGYGDEGLPSGGLTAPASHGPTAAPAKGPAPKPAKH